MSATPLPRGLVFGCAAMGGHDYGPVDDATSTRAVHAALDAGITAFDTADVYGLGHAETVLGRALVGQRERAFIATKAGVAFDATGRTWRTLSPAWLEQALMASLRRLCTDHVDLWQLHWPVPGTDYSALRAWLEPWRARGVVRAVGCCNMAIEDVDALQRGGPVASLQVGFNLLERQMTPVLHGAQARGLHTLVHSALAQGLLAGAHRAAETFALPDLRARHGIFRSPTLPTHLAAVRTLDAVAQQLGRPAAQVALRWALEQPCVDAVLCGIKHPWQVHELAAARDWQLPADARSQLDALASPTSPPVA
ncbi:MAG: aldo/keto reductase [Gemmatimonadetes bacterium]|nr:aldo/keto reductase [Gemmatimonadota bacterium]